jgi:hypothetical protein
MLCCEPGTAGTITFCLSGTEMHYIPVQEPDLDPDLTKDVIKKF